MQNAKGALKLRIVPLYYYLSSFHVLILSVFFQVLVALFSGALVSFGFLLFFYVHCLLLLRIHSSEKTYSSSRFTSIVGVFLA